MDKLRCVLIDPERGAEAVEIERSLGAYCKAIGCDLIDITCRTIGDTGYDIIVDDEGLLKGTPMVSAAYRSGEFALVGRLIVCMHDEDGNEVSLTDGQIKEVLGNVTEYCGGSILLLDY